MNYEVVCLADRVDLIDQCVDLLNDQWPRSKTARLRSLEQCRSGELPTSLVLIDKSSGRTVVVGHSKISPVPGRRNACFVESVVISKKLRGKGLGRLIMEATENFVKRMGIKTVHLTTLDQQGFYERLGYKLSEPITVFGGISSSLQKLLEYNEKQSQGSNSISPQSADRLNNEAMKKPVDDRNCVTEPSAPLPPAPAPPPPPGPPSIVKLSPDQLKKVYMKKCL